MHLFARLPLLKTCLFTSLAILAVKLFNVLFVYHFFSLDIYLAVVALSFLMAGYFLFYENNSSKSTELLTPSDTEYDKGQELKIIRYSLTNRELAIFRHLTEGKTNKEISSILGISVSTVKTHINNLFAKIRCKSRRETIEKWNEMFLKSLI